MHTLCTVQISLLVLRFSDIVEIEKILGQWGEFWPFLIQIYALVPWKLNTRGLHLIYMTTIQDTESIPSESGFIFRTILQSECFRAKMNPIFTVFSTGSNFVPKQNSASAVQDFSIECVIAHIMHCPDLSGDS